MPPWRIDSVLGGSSDVPTLRASPPDPGDHPLADRVPLELGDGCQDVDRRRPAGVVVSMA